MRAGSTSRGALCGLLAFLAMLAPVAAQSLADIQGRFDRETSGVQKAKLIGKLGDAQFEEARRAGKAGEYTAVGFTLEKYRDNVRAAVDALKKQHPDAEKQSNGYRQLEMYVRRGIRELDDTLLVSPEGYKPPLEIVRQDLIGMDDELLKMLFPRRPLEQRPAKPPAGETTMRLKLHLFLLCSLILVVSPSLRAAAAQQKDYLTSLEADKIRDAETVNERIKLFLTFADDRLKKFQYELEHPSTNRHGDMLNSLMNAYVGCVDDAADLIELGLEKQENIRQGVDLMAARTKDFLVVLEKLSNDGPEREIYKDNLDDAIEGTRDAMNDAEKAKKKVAPPPVRRKN